MRVLIIPFVATVLLGCTLTAPEAGSDRPHLLVPDVGQGHAVAVVQGSRAVVVDAGPPGTSALDRALREDGVESIELLVITHPDLDHAGGLDSLTIPVRSVVHGAMSPEDSSRVLRRFAHAPGGCRRSTALSLEAVLDGLEMRTIGPFDTATSPETNANSLVVEFRWCGRGVFLSSGDLDTTGELRLLDRLEPVDVVQLGHHGSASSSHLRWLGAMMPSRVVLQAGSTNPYGHPSPSAVARALALGCKLLRPMGKPLRVEF